MIICYKKHRTTTDILIKCKKKIINIIMIILCMHVLANKYIQIKLIYILGNTFTMYVIYYNVFFYICITE